jgi:hypothetical protein
MQLHRSSALDAVVASVQAWPGVAVVPHRFGGAAFRLGHIELGHVHADGTLDLYFPVALRDRLIDEGWANIHHILPASGWVTFFVAERADVDQALRLLRVAYLRRRLGARGNDNEAVLEVSRLDASPALLATLLGKVATPRSATIH